MASVFPAPVFRRRHPILLLEYFDEIVVVVIADEAADFLDRRFAGFQHTGLFHAMGDCSDKLL